MGTPEKDRKKKGPYSEPDAETLQKYASAPGSAAISTRSRKGVLLAFSVLIICLAATFYAFRKPMPKAMPILILIIGLLFSFLVFFIIYGISTTGARAEALAERMTDELKRKQEELMLRDRAFNSTTTSIIITDPNKPDNPIVYCNPAFEQISGYSVEEAIGKNPRFLHGKDNNQECFAQVRDAIRSRTECKATFRNYKKDGTMYWNEAVISPVFDEDGKIMNFIGISTDITERKMTEERLISRTAELEKFQRLTVDRELKMIGLKKKLKELTPRKDENADDDGFMEKPGIT